MYRVQITLRRTARFIMYVANLHLIKEFYNEVRLEAIPNILIAWVDWNSFEVQSVQSAGCIFDDVSICIV